MTARVLSFEQRLELIEAAGKPQLEVVPRLDLWRLQPVADYIEADPDAGGVHLTWSDEAGEPYVVKICNSSTKFRGWGRVLVRALQSGYPGATWRAARINAPAIAFWDKMHAELGVELVSDEETSLQDRELGRADPYDRPPCYMSHLDEIVADRSR